MKITISTLGKFILFYLAQELDRMGHLHQVLSDHYSQASPWLGWLRRDPESISPQRCQLFPWVNLLRIPRRMAGFATGKRLDVLMCDLFDRWASDQLSGAKVVVARTNVAERTFRRAREKGIRTVLFRGSAHIEEQFALLDDEYRRFGFRFNPHAALRDKELREYELSDHILVLSSYSRRTFVRRGIRGKKVIVSQPGVDPVIFRPGKQRRRNRRILFVGGIGFEKGIPYLASAAARLGVRREDLVLIGNMDQECEQYLRKSGSRYTHLSPLPWPALRGWYQESEMLVLPSVQDGFGAVILEAMACGCPVVATTHTGGPDVIRNGWNGYLVPPRDPLALADRMDRILSADGAGFARLGRHARKTAVAFTWRLFASRLLTGLRSGRGGHAPTAPH